MNKSFYNQVYCQVQKIPPGRVATYGQIAKLCGSPRASRAVGTALHKNPTSDIVPCYRVVNREGYLSKHFALGGYIGQKERLIADGVIVDENFKVDLKQYLWM